MKKYAILLHPPNHNTSRKEHHMDFLNNIPYLNLLTDSSTRPRILAVLAFFANMAFACLKLAFGLYARSWWLISLGFYYGVLAFLRLSLVRCLWQPQLYNARRLYRRTALLLNLLTFAMAGIFVQLVRNDESFRYPGVLIYAMALWAFIKIISAIVNLVRPGHDPAPVPSALRCLSFAAALMSIQALQTALISQFGADSIRFAHLMNGILGAVITFLMLLLSIGMLLRSARQR